MAVRCTHNSHNSWRFLSTSYGCGGWHDCWVDWLWDDTINSLLFVHKCAACNTTFSAVWDHFDQLWLNPLRITVIILQTWILVVFWGCNLVIHLYRFSLCEVLCTVVWALQSHGSNMGTARHQLWAFRQCEDRQGERGHCGFSRFFLYCKLTSVFWYLYILLAKGGLHTALWGVFR